MKRVSTYIYIAIVTLSVAAFCIVFNIFPRSTKSELEGRELKSFPKFSWEELWSGKFMSEISSWYSDSEPYRDNFMTLSMEVDKAKKLNIASKGDDEVTFIAGNDEGESSDAATPALPAADITNITEAQADSLKMTLEDKAKITNSGIVIVGSQPNVRALMAYKGKPNCCNTFANMANKYSQSFGEGVQIYCMIIPTAVEFYCPEKAKSKMKSQIETINEAYSKLDSTVIAVDVYNPLCNHRHEDIYLRTDHHWSPRGAYYAAKALAEAAGVPFKDLSSYDELSISGYVGSMYRYSKDISVKKSPEKFVYYKPRDIEYSTTYINYAIDEEYNVTAESGPVKGDFFVTFKNPAYAYCTFMGSDTKITQVRTATKNNRRLIIIKDSFGNAIPGYLFYSFEEIHVIDTRYFTKNIIKYAKKHQITDLVLTNNIAFASSYTTLASYSRFLTQR